jgi:dihydrofolate synthase/folylpolyglutamate synthase
MNYPEAIAWLERLTHFGLRPGLETTRALAARAGDPQNRLRFLHVAGTNGKGSTCAFLASIYRAAGLRVGLYTSPHLVSFRERIQVDGRLIPEAEVARLTAELRAHCDGAPASGPALQPTFFEFVTVLALRYFAEQQCDLVVWETGLGGRLDATNIVTPLASVITNISLDHTQWLGDTLEKIAAEKAGIIKPRVPVLKADDPPEVLAVFERVARENDAPLRIVTATDTQHPPLDRIELPLLGEHQRLNAALALATVKLLQPSLPVSAHAIERGLREVQWPGRLQLIRTAAGQDILLDGAHNPAGAEQLRGALAKHFPGRPPALLLGVLADKDSTGIVRALAPLAGRIYTVPVDSPRSLPAAELAAACRAAHPAAKVIPCASAAKALERAAAAPFLVVTGSLYLVGEALARIGHASGDERALNDYGGATVPSPPSKGHV